MNGFLLIHLFRLIEREKIVALSLPSYLRCPVLLCISLMLFLVLLKIKRVKKWRKEELLTVCDCICLVGKQSSFDILFNDWILTIFENVVRWDVGILVSFHSNRFAISTNITNIMNPKHVAQLSVNRITANLFRSFVLFIFISAVSFVYDELTILNECTACALYICTHRNFNTWNKIFGIIGASLDLKLWILRSKFEIKHGVCNRFRSVQGNS